MKTILAIASRDSLDAAVAAVVRLKIDRTRIVAEKERETSAIEKTYQPRLEAVLQDIGIIESKILEYCHAHRAELFPDKKSRETTLAVFGFELTPTRVETASRKIKWKDVVERLLRLAWGKAYVRQPEPQPDKQALLADREKLTAEQIMAAGIQFAQDEQFFIRPKPETAEATIAEAA